MASERHGAPLGRVSLWTFSINMQPLTELRAQTGQSLSNSVALGAAFHGEILTQSLGST